MVKSLRKIQFQFNIGGISATRTTDFAACHIPLLLSKQVMKKKNKNRFSARQNKIFWKDS